MSIDDLQRSADNSEEAALTKSQEVPEEKSSGDFTGPRGLLNNPIRLLQAKALWKTSFPVKYY